MASQVERAIHAFATSVISLVVVNSAPAQFYVGGSNFVGSGSQANSQGLAGSDKQGGPEMFSYNPSYSSGEGNSQSASTPGTTQYGASIQSAAGYWALDDIARQQAFLQGRMQYQDVEMRRLQLRRAAFDEMRYEKLYARPPEVIREDARLERLNRARNTPPREEIVTGDALNILLNNIQRVHTRDGVNGKTIPLSSETVSHINVTTTDDGSGSNEFFKPGNFPNWPHAFASTGFDDYKKRLQSDLVELANAQLKGKVDSASAADAKRTLESIKARLFELRTNFGFNDYVAASEFLSKQSNMIDTLSKQGARKIPRRHVRRQGRQLSRTCRVYELQGVEIRAGCFGP